MPRLNNGLEVLKGISKVEAFQIVTSTPGDTVTTAALAVGDATIGVSASTNFTAADPIFIIGDGGVELNKIGTPNATMPLGFKAALAQSAGARLVEAVARNLGHIDNNGVQYSASVALTPIDAATSVTPIGYQRGVGELTAQFGLRGWNNLNFQFAHGVDESESGVGSSADPTQIVIGGSQLGTHSTMCCRVTGYRYDGKTVTQDFLNVTIEVQVRTNIGGSTPAVLPVSMKFDNVVQRIWS
jgi:hypothetical protein